MRYILSWIKANPVTVVSIMVVIISLGFISWVFLLNGALKDRMASQARTIREIQNLQKLTVEVPSEHPDEPPQILKNITVNPAALDKRKKINKGMDREYGGVFAYAVERNRHGHGLLADGLFPKPEDESLPWRARDLYRRSFEVMLKGYWGELRTEEKVEFARGWGLPFLDAGMPPTSQEVGQTLAAAKADLLGSGFSDSNVFDEDLIEEQTSTLRELLLDRAGHYHIYAETNIESRDFPFKIGAWSNANKTPEPYELWEGQLELWIQQDIVEAIARTNAIDDPEASVLNAPVKHLIEVSVVPGYVGLHSVGGMDPAMARASKGQSLYPAPEGGQRTDNPDQRQSDNFYVGPTGRVSNAVYDVRHARLVAVVEFERLNELMENIASVNFMTVLNCNISSVDEYDSLANGLFIYGSRDAVRVELVIETIWLREWTKDLMPDLVRQYVGLDEPTDALNQAPGLSPGGFGPGGFGPPGSLGPPGNLGPPGGGASDMQFY